MGTSTDAILFYGYCWDEEGRRPWVPEDSDEEPEDDDWEERFARLSGLVAPTTPFPSREQKPTAENGYNRYVREEDYTPEEKAIAKEYSGYWELKRALVAMSGVEVSTHCSSECPMYYVAISKSQVKSWRGSMNEIKSLKIGTDWKKQLRAFCKLMGISIKGKKPGWWLVSDWG